ncbi:acyl-CoA synthetase, partial [Vibrio nigripulchritudo ATCC 27043]
YPLCALEEVSEASEKVGFPVVLKGVSEKLVHKTESGAVALNLTRAVDCETAANTMAIRLNQCGIADYQFMVEPMIRDTVAEMIVGLKRDEQFGLALVVGSGGILVNLIHDSRTLLLPTNQVEIEEAIKSLRGSQLLYGYRNQKTADIEALIDAVMAVSEFAMTHWEQIEEVDINPILVRPAGKGVVAADAFIKLVMK